jgi:hypothetical protein
MEDVHREIAKHHACGEAERRLTDGFDIAWKFWLSALMIISVEATARRSSQRHQHEQQWRS